MPTHYEKPKILFDLLTQQESGAAGLLRAAAAILEKT